MINKNFTFLISGRVLTNIGDSLYAVASMWLIYDLTHNSFFTGLAGFLTSAPIALQFFIGPLINQAKYKSILIYSQMIQAILLMFIPLAYFFGFLSVWIVLIINPVVSIIQQFVYPTQAALLPSIVDKEHITKANSVMSATYQLLDVILLGVSGIIIAAMGAVSVYTLNSATFLMAMTLFFYLKVPKTEFNETENDSDLTLSDKWKSYKTDLTDGYRFIKNSFIPKFLLAAILANFIIGAVSAILPEYSAERGGSNVYGWYLGAMSGGLLVGSLISSFFDKISLGRVTIVGFFISGISWLIAGITNITLLSVFLYGFSYIAIGMTNVLFLSSLQKVVPSDYLGRVFSFVAGATALATPLGALIGGATATVTGSWMIFMGGSAATMFVSFYWIVIPTLRNMPSPSSFEAETLFEAKQA
ncbi:MULTISPECIES: MFS transporter [Sediminibacillus]|uniref:MFS transporter n=1 Tax=Sediminibacillus TaxID=482460 RepID=UPI001296E5EB|nr:MFS transporter [Sediminibacillus terrae]